MLKTCDEEGCGTVSFDEWIAWITHEKHTHDRMLWLKKPWRSFIVILSVTQLILGIVKRIEKAYFCYDYSFAGHKTCPYVRPFHDTMIFKSCLRFEAWRYVTHAFAHHGTPHLLINLVFQIIFGKNLVFCFLFFLFFGRRGLVHVPEPENCFSYDRLV